MFRGLTLRRTARSWPLHSRGGWLVMMAVTRSRRVGGGGGRGVLRSERVRPGRRSAGGVLMAMSIAVMAAGWGGRASSRLGDRGVAQLTFAAADAGGAGGRHVGHPRPADHAGQAGRAVRADPGGVGELVFGRFRRGG